MIAGMTKLFMFHILWISILRFLHFNFFSASFCITFLNDGIATSIDKQVLSFLFLTIMSLLLLLLLLLLFDHHNVIRWIFTYRFLSFGVCIWPSIDVSATKANGWQVYDLKQSLARGYQLKYSIYYWHVAAVSESTVEILHFMCRVRRKVVTFVS
jgi:hypothetical protein